MQSNQQIRVKVIVYKNLDLIHQDRRPQLFADLEDTFGIRNIVKVQIGKIDTVKNLAQLKVFFIDVENQHFSDDYQD